MEYGKLRALLKSSLAGTLALVTALPALSGLSLLEVSAASGSNTYPLFICGEQVTDSNKEDILGDGIFRYVPQSNQQQTPLLIVCGDKDFNGTVIDSGASLTIDVQGDSTLTASQSDAIRGNNGTLMITGTGELALHAPNGCGISMGYDSNLRICELNRMNIGVSKYGIRGPEYSSLYDGTSLYFDHAQVWIDVDNSAIERIAGAINMTCCSVGNAVAWGRNAEGQYLTAIDSTDVLNSVYIFPDEAHYENYALTIGGIPVSVVNRNDVLGNGVFKYDPDNNVLKINGVHKTVNHAGEAMIINKIENLKIRTVSDSVLTAIDNHVLQTMYDTEIIGSSKLTMNADTTTYDCIWDVGGTLTIRDANLVLSGARAIGGTSEVTDLVIDRSAVQASGSISGFRDITLTGCGIEFPADGRIQEINSINAICYLGENDHVILAPAVTISVNTPKIGSQPQDITAAVGEKVQFIVAASGADLTYRWQYNSGSGWKDSTLKGYNTETLTVPAIATRNGLKYRCIISCDSGYTVISDYATMTVVDATNITKQPVSTSGCVGDTVKFAVTAEGTDLKYKWQYNAGSGWKDTSLTGYNTATLKVPVIATRNGIKYHCIVTGADGQSKTSSAATLTVNVNITKQPVNISGKIGNTAEFSVTATGAGTLSYQWQCDTGNGFKNSNFVTAQTAVLRVPVTAARDGYKYRCIVTSTNGKTATSGTATLQVNAAITKQPVSATQAIGTTAKFTVTASGAGTLSYQWQCDTGRGWKDSGFATANTATLNVPVTAARNRYKYRCIVTSSNGTTVTSKQVTLTVK